MCWEWDPTARPTFTELRVKFEEIFGESSSGCNLCCENLHSIKNICSALQKPKATTQRLRMVNIPMRKMTQDQCVRNLLLTVVEKHWKVQTMQTVVETVVENMNNYFEELCVISVHVWYLVATLLPSQLKMLKQFCFRLNEFHSLCHKIFPSACVICCLGSQDA